MWIAFTVLQDKAWICLCRQILRDEKKLFVLAKLMMGSFIRPEISRGLGPLAHDICSLLHLHFSTDVQHSLHLWLTDALTWVVCVPPEGSGDTSHQTWSNGGCFCSFNTFHFHLFSLVFLSVILLRHAVLFMNEAGAQGGLLLAS